MSAGRDLRDEHARAIGETMRPSRRRRSAMRRPHRHRREEPLRTARGSPRADAAGRRRSRGRRRTRPRRSPSSTAPPSPPVRASRWISRTGRAADAATSRITSGVSSVLSSTKMTSASMPSAAAVTRRTSSATFGASLNVGTMIESCTALHRRMSPETAQIRDATSTSRTGPTPRTPRRIVQDRSVRIEGDFPLHHHDVRRGLVPRLRPHQDPARPARRQLHVHRPSDRSRSRRCRARDLRPHEHSRGGLSGFLAPRRAIERRRRGQTSASSPCLAGLTPLAHPAAAGRGTLGAIPPPRGGNSKVSSAWRSLRPPGPCP